MDEHEHNITQVRINQINGPQNVGDPDVVTVACACGWESDEGSSETVARVAHEEVHLVAVEEAEFISDIP